jgi:hypothetical protein
MLGKRSASAILRSAEDARVEDKFGSFSRLKFMLSVIHFNVFLEHILNMPHQYHT